MSSVACSLPNIKSALAQGPFLDFLHTSHQDFVYLYVYLSRQQLSTHFPPFLTPPSIIVSNIFYICSIIKLKKNHSTFKVKHAIRKQLGIKSVYKSVYKSQVCIRTLDPVWNEVTSFLFQDFSEYITVNVFDRDRISRDDFLGKIRVPLADLMSNPVTHKWHNMYDKRLECRVQGQVNMKMIATRLPRIDPTADSKLIHDLFLHKRQVACKHVSELELPHPPSEVVRFCVCTWNVGNAAPSKDLRSWILHKEIVEDIDATTVFAEINGADRDDIDFFVFGLQEAEFSPTEPFNSAKEALLDTISKHVGANYSLISSHSLWEMRILLFVAEKHLNKINHVEVGSVGTGIANILGNKGGVACSFSFRHTSFCFVNAHLAAHQGYSNDRNTDFCEIVKAMRLGSRQMDFLNQFHHVVFFGDLNYRLNFANQQDKSPTEEQFHRMVSLIENQQYAELFEQDQLTLEQQQDRVLPGFQEGTYNFPPSFKFVRNRGLELQYDSKRSPAWTDRVLWKSAPGAADRMRLQHMSLAMPIDSSDHKPLFCMFRAITSTRLAAVDVLRGECTMRISGLHADIHPPDKLGMDVDEDVIHIDAGATDTGTSLGHSADDQSLQSLDTIIVDSPIVDLQKLEPDTKRARLSPYVKFSAPFLLQSVVTEAKKHTVTPKWHDHEIPALRPKFNCMERLAQQYVYVRIFQYHRTRQSEAYANGMISLAPLASLPGTGAQKQRDAALPRLRWQRAELPFVCPLTCNGQPAGTLSGKLQIMWDDIHPDQQITVDQTLSKDTASNQYSIGTAGDPAPHVDSSIYTFQVRLSTQLPSIMCVEKATSDLKQVTVDSNRNEAAIENELIAAIEQWPVHRSPLLYTTGTLVTRRVTIIRESDIANEPLSQPVVQSVTVTPAKLQQRDLLVPSLPPRHERSDSVASTASRTARLAASIQARTGISSSESAAADTKDQTVTVADNVMDIITPSHALTFTESDKLDPTRRVDAAAAGDSSNDVNVMSDADSASESDDDAVVSVTVARKSSLLPHVFVATDI
jgi:Endonuclease/Exonuclease/phosphatase family 2/C2 domain